MSSTETTADWMCKVRIWLLQNYVGWIFLFSGASPSLCLGSSIGLEVVNSIKNTSSPSRSVYCLHLPVCQIDVTVAEAALKAVLVAEILATGRTLTRTQSTIQNTFGESRIIHAQNMARPLQRRLYQHCAHCRTS